MSQLDPASPVVVVSPHLDDAVLSCAGFLHEHPATTVVTVFAGAPEVAHEGYNSATTGKAYAPDAVQVRREEDQSATALLGAVPIWLELFDSDYEQYRPTGDYGQAVRNDVARAIDELEPLAVIAPLGLIHPDHVTASDACARIAAESALEWYFYMDLPYGMGNRRAVARRLFGLRQRLEVVELDPYDVAPGIKQQAMSRYASQYEPTRNNYRRGFDATMRGGERYWRAKPLA